MAPEEGTQRASPVVWLGAATGSFLLFAISNFVSGRALAARVGVSEVDVEELWDRVSYSAQVWSLSGFAYFGSSAALLALTTCSKPRPGGGVHGGVSGGDDASLEEIALQEPVAAPAAAAVAPAAVVPAQQPRHSWSARLLGFVCGLLHGLGQCSLVVGFAFDQAGKGAIVSIGAGCTVVVAVCRFGELFENSFTCAQVVFDFGVYLVSAVGFCSASD